MLLKETNVLCTIENLLKVEFYVHNFFKYICVNTLFFCCLKTKETQNCTVFLYYLYLLFSCKSRTNYVFNKKNKLTTKHEFCSKQ